MKGRLWPFGLNIWGQSGSEKTQQSGCMFCSQYLLVLLLQHDERVFIFICFLCLVFLIDHDRPRMHHQEHHTHGCKNAIQSLCILLWIQDFTWARDLTVWTKSYALKSLLSLVSSVFFPEAQSKSDMKKGSESLLFIVGIHMVNLMNLMNIFLFLKYFLRTQTKLCP